MDEGWHQRAHRLAATLATLPATAREDELRRRCAGDEELERAVRGRLRACLLGGLTSTTSPVTGPDEARRSSPEHAPERLGRFRVIRVLGRGGMGIAYEAEQELPRRRVALKTLPRGHSAEAVAQFRIEVEATARVVHPGIPQVFEVFELDGAPVLVMELVEGQHLIQAAAQLDLEQRVRVLRDIALAVRAAHERGVIHRDLKPGNVLLTSRGQPKVLDFGVAALGGESRKEGSSSCTPGYAAPEQLLGEEQDLRCDVYGLGAIGLELLAGRLVVDPRGLSPKTLAQRKLAAIEPPPELPSALAAVLLRALAPEPAQRYRCRCRCPAWRRLPAARQYRPGPPERRRRPVPSGPFSSVDSL
ncbi:MAG: serine/threonine-protein kinase, partial [Enhygromyxa sp.]